MTTRRTTGGIKRRDLLNFFAFALIPPSALAASTARLPPLLSAYGDADGRFGIAAIGPDGIVVSAELPGRAHAAIAHPDGDHALVVARRPGWFAARVKLATLEMIGDIAPAANRHFYGHGAFSRDGARFFTTENDYAGERGVIGVREVDDDYRQSGEWPSGGIGPHELALAPDGNSLLVANGGILTHPDSGRSKLNLMSMRPNLTRLDAASGAVLAQHALADKLRYLSIRHLALSDADEVVFGMQNEASLDPGLPLVGVWRRDGSVDLFEPTAALTQGYVGSVAVAGRVAAASAPRDGLVVFYDLDSGRRLSTLHLPDGCGVAAAKTAGEFWLSSGLGWLLRVGIDAAGVTLRRRVKLDPYWDNHLLRV